MTMTDADEESPSRTERDSKDRLFRGFALLDEELDEQLRAVAREHASEHVSDNAPFDTSPETFGVRGLTIDDGVLHYELKHPHIRGEL